MLTKIWTTAIVLSAAASLVAWVCVAAHARGIRPLRAIARFTQKLSLAGVVVFGLMAAPLYRAGSTKVGGGTNNVPPNLNQPLPQMQQRDILSQTGFTGLTGFVGEGNPVNHVQDPITSTNTTRMLTAEDFERGFVMARVGTSEGVDFSAPSNAVVCVDWMEDGAAVDWVYVAMTNWMFKVGTNNVEHLRVYSFGKIEPLIREASGSMATNNWFAPFMASLGVVPEANWELLDETDRPSLVWYCITPDNALVVTWQNVLFDRDTEKPVSFQVEFFTDGRFVFRYDLSRLDGETAANFLSGTSFDGNEWTTNSLPTNVTSMAFYPLSENDAYDQDPDGDGLLTIDELFFYDTDPHNADTDYDGLSDYDELLVYSSDPLDPNSISAAYCDGLAAKLGDLDPFSCPEGSTSTIYEHIFYTGTTNAPFAYPTSTVETAVLKIMVSGVGTGRLVVGDAVVPLVGASQTGLTRLTGLRGTANPDNPVNPVTNTLLLAVGKGVRKELWFDKPDGLDVAINSDDLLIGRMPTWYLPHGWIAFPHTDATQPCIHDLYAEFRWVSLVHGEEFPGLTATWESDSVNVEIWNDGIVSAEITGHFPKNASRVVTYTVDHPNRLNSAPMTFQQTVRFCPRLAESDLAEYGIEDEEAEPAGGWCMCGYSGCDWCYGRCSGNCPCCAAQAADETTEEAAAAEYTRIAALQEAGGVLQLYGQSGRVDSVLLQVPTGEPVHCCDCPEHWQHNHVSLAGRSQRLVVLDSEDADFVESAENVFVRVIGTAPSAGVGTEAVLFATNGTPSVCRRYTVLGVRIEGNSGPPMETFNALSQSFGYPMTICTNLESGAELTLRTDVLLTNGVFRLALENVTGRFEVWTAGCDNSLWGAGYGVVPPVKLLDSESSTERYFTMRQWRSLLAEYVNYGRALPLRVVSAESGHCDLCFSFVHDSGGRSIASAVRQRITSVKPPLLPDYDQDGVIGDTDVAEYIGCRTFRFWTNEDTAKGDYLGQNSDTTPNAIDLEVNGRLDLVNLFPLKLDLKPFIDAWGREASFVLWGVGKALRFCGTDMSTNNVWEYQTNDVYTTTGDNIAGGELTPIGGEGAEIAPIDYLGNGNAPGVLVFEAAGTVTAYNSPMLLVIVDNVAVYGFRLPMSITPVREMYGWINGRHLSGAPESRTTVLNKTWGEEGVKSLVFLHGVNVPEADAEKWGDALFKRLYLSGAHVNFYNVDWRSDIGSNANYHENASNAFVVASQLVTEITNSIPGEKVVMAHSLGNMVVSSMIQDYGLEVSKYIMCDSAVPSEAYYPANDVSIRVPQLVHPDWEEYPTNSWASNWHKLFVDDLYDDRRKLGWPGRFIDVAQYAVNFYSTGDEVLELSDDNDIYVWTGVTSGYVQYSWHHQELWKGRAAANVLGGTTWSGWNIEENLLGVNKISVSAAQQMQAEDFKTNTVFYCYPSSMNSTNISLLVRAAHLAQGIPALARPTGGRDLYNVLDWQDYFDMNLPEERQVDDDGLTITQGIPRPNGWPTRVRWNDRWKHSDMKDVSFFYNFKFYEKLVEKGEL